MTEYEVHPAADLFPMMSDAEIEALGEDMLEHGQREDIILFHGMVLDGRNRYRACLLKGINPRFHEERPADPYAFVASANLHRRHLDASQRAMVAAKLATMKQGARTDLASSRREVGTAPWIAEAMSDADAAAAMKVGERSVERAKTVRREAVPEIVHAVEQGEVSVSAAAEFAKQPKEDQTKQITAAGSPAAAVKASAAVKAKTKNAKTGSNAKKRRKTDLHVLDAADRAEESAAAKQATLAPQKLADAVKQLGNVDAKAAALWMSDDERAGLMAEIIRVADEKVIEIATVGGAKLGRLAPPSKRFEALDFLRKAISRIDAELSSQAAQVPVREGDDRADVAPLHANSDDGDRRRWDDDDPRWMEVRP
jgi:hypothetical protein